MQNDLPFDIEKHPCFSRDAQHKFGRIHLPVAPRCNIQCNFCNRKFDCMNESRPGVTSSVMKPEAAMEYIEEVISKRPEIAVLGIAGPGDPFANPAETMETLRLARARFPEQMLCLASNGLEIGPHIDEIAELKVSHVTITMTAIDPAIGGQIYAWVRDGRTPLRGEEGAALLIQRQIDAITRLKARGVVVKVNSIIVPGVNDAHIPEIAKFVAGLGVDIMNCMPLVPVPGAAFEELPEPDALMTARVRLQCGEFLSQMGHCSRCRADAVGLIGEQMTVEQMATVDAFSGGKANLGRKRPYIAVASREGARVNLHLGEVASVLIFKEDASTESGFKFKEIRRAPEPGGGAARWTELADMLHDCRAFLVSASGSTPKSILQARGVKVVEMEGMIEPALAAVFAGQPLPKELRRKFEGCTPGSSCGGTAAGCASA